MATLISNASGSMTTGNIFATVDAATSLQLVGGANNNWGGASTQTSAAFVVTNGAVIDGLFLWLKLNAVDLTGTIKVDLQKGGVSQSSVTVNKSDIAMDVSNEGWGPTFFRFPANVTGDGGANWTIVCTTTGTATVQFSYLTATNNWTRALRTTTTRVAAAGDDLYMLGELTGPGAHTAFTFAMDSLTPLIVYGNGSANSATVRGGIIVVGNWATLAYGTWNGSAVDPPAPGTNYVLRLAGDLLVGNQGTLNISSSAEAILTNAAPSNTALPVIVGVAATSVLLATTDGTWTGVPIPTRTYQWKRGGADISGATASTYTPVTADIGSTLTVTVTATNTGGSASATSAATATIVAWSPLLLSGLIGWWDPSVTASLSLAGANINTIADQSGGGNTLTWSLANPTYNATGLNSRPAIVIASGQSFQKLSFPMGTGSTLTWFFVGTMSTIVGRILSYGGLGQSQDYNNSVSWLVNTTNATTLQMYRASTSCIAGAAVPPAIHRFIGTISSSGVMQCYVNGLMGNTGSSGGSWTTGGSFNVGRNAFNTTEFHAGTLGEIGVAAGFSDAATVATLDTYLKNKWGL